MKKGLFSTLGILVASLTIAGTARAQVFTPTFQSPRLLNEIGVSLSNGPGDLAVEGIWRGGPLGLRLGFVDAHGGLLSVGGELRSPLQVTAAPMGLAFTAAAQGLIGDHAGIGVQAGLSAGYTFRGQGLVFTPYLHPRVGMVSPIGPNNEFGFEVLADVGADVEFYNNILVRLGVKLDDNGSDWGIAFGIRR